jgi:hypothetical protein
MESLLQALAYTTTAIAAAVVRTLSAIIRLSDAGTFST